MREMSSRVVAPLDVGGHRPFQAFDIASQRDARRLRHGFDMGGDPVYQQEYRGHRIAQFVGRYGNEFVARPHRIEQFGDAKV
jgi:hypothetical protein